MELCNWIPNLVLVKAATSLHVVGIQLGLGIGLLGSELGRKARAIAAANLGATLLFCAATQLFMPEQLRIAFRQTAPSLQIMWLLGLLLYFAGTLLPQTRDSHSLRRITASIGAGLSLVSVCVLDGLGGTIAATGGVGGIPIPEVGVILRLAAVIGSSYFLGALTICTKKGLSLNRLVIMAWISGLIASTTLFSHKIGFVGRIDGIAERLLEVVGFGWAIFALGLVFFSKLSRGDHLGRQCSYAIIPVAYLMTILGFWGPSLLKLPAASMEGYYANGLDITETRVFRRAQFLREGEAAGGAKIFRRQCGSCHGERGPWKLASSLKGWEMKQLSLFLESAREADLPSSKLYEKMPPLRGNDEEVWLLGRFLFEAAR